MDPSCMYGPVCSRCRKVGVLKVPTMSGCLEAVVRHYNRLDGAMLDHHGEALLQPLGLDEVSELDLVAFLRSLSVQIGR